MCVFFLVKEQIMEKTDRMLSLRDAGEYDRENGARNKLTGWGKVSAKRAGDNSKSQRRRRNRREGKHNNPSSR